MENFFFWKNDKRTHGEGKYFFKPSSCELGCQFTEEKMVTPGDQIDGSERKLHRMLRRGDKFIPKRWREKGT